MTRTASISNATANAVELMPVLWAETSSSFNNAGASTGSSACRAKQLGITNGGRPSRRTHRPTAAGTFIGGSWTTNVAARKATRRSNVSAVGTLDGVNIVKTAFRNARLDDARCDRSTSLLVVYGRLPLHAQR